MLYQAVGEEGATQVDTLIKQKSFPFPIKSIFFLVGLTVLNAHHYNAECTSQK